MREVVQAVAQSPKSGAAVSAATTGTGLGTFLDLIPNDIGKLATLVGIVLSVILIYSHLLTVRKTRIEIAIKELEKAAARRRYDAD